MSLDAYPPNPRGDGTSMIVYAGPPGVAVSWSLDGPGAILARSACTDERGVAGAIYYPPEGLTAATSVTISVTHGM